MWQTLLDLWFPALVAPIALVRALSEALAAGARPMRGGRS